MKNVKDNFDLRIVWAIDALGDIGSLYRTAAAFLRKLDENLKCKVLPVYVLSMRSASLELGREYVSSVKLKEDAISRMRELIERFGIKNAQMPEVLVSEGMSRGQDTLDLSRFAVKHSADMILLNTHARRGMKRMALGSFTEAALLQSQVPVFTLNPYVTRIPRLKHLLFPTEFGPYSLRIFNRVLDLARSLDAKVTLMHIVPSVLRKEVLIGAFGYPIPSPVVGNELFDRKKNAQRKFQRWVEMGRKRGVTVDTLIVPPAKSISEQIVETARATSVDLICMESESGWIRAAMLGSIAREVIREARCPVWAVRARKAKAYRRRKEAASRAA